MHINGARNAYSSAPKCYTAPSVLLNLLLSAPLLPLAACFRGEAALQREDLFSQPVCLLKSLALTNLCNLLHEME